MIQQYLTGPCILLSIYSQVHSSYYFFFVLSWFFKISLMGAVMLLAHYTFQHWNKK